MPTEVEAIAENLRAFVERRLGVPVARVKDDAPAEGPVVRARSASYGDPYSGYQYVDVITVENAGALRVTFEVWEHDLSGQCDHWTVDVAGVEGDDRKALFKLFHPRQRSGHWGANARVEPPWDWWNGCFSE